MFTCSPFSDIRILSRRQDHLQFVPEPLAGSRKIKIVAFDGVAVGEGHAPASRMTRSGPVAGLQQHGAKNAEFDHFTSHTVNLHPIAEADAVLPHEREPSEEADDEILERHGKAGAGRAPETCPIVPAARKSRAR